MLDLGLDGRVVVVSGASQGIGRDTARAFVEQGAEVIAFARRVEPIAALAAELGAEGRRVLPVAADVTDPGTPDRIHELVRERFDRLDVLVNVAGGSKPVLVEAPDEVWRESMEVKFFAPRRLTHRLLDLMAEGGYGRVLTLSGSSEPTPYPLPEGSRRSALNTANSATGAVHGWAKGLSREVGRQGITVNSVVPSSVESEQMGRIFPDEASRRAHIEANIPVGRFGTPRDVSALLLFLASPLAGYITGEVFHVDGGRRRYAY